jgi:hypothetical protein
MRVRYLEEVRGKLRRFIEDVKSGEYDEFRG